MTRRVAVAATSELAAQAGIALAHQGGNAVDACVAAALTAMVSEPGITSVGGGGYVSIWSPEGGPVVIDGNVEMPGRGADPERIGHGVRELTTAYGGGVSFYAGHGSVATPGTLAMCQDAVEGHGRAPWSEVVRPAIAAARDGFTVGSSSAYYLGYVGRDLFRDPAAYALVSGTDGEPLRAGDLATNPLLAETLQEVARQGSSLLTVGELGRVLAADMEEHGGLITLRDLAEYEPLERIPVRRSVGDWDLAINPPPSVGGPMLAAMLGELARRRDWRWADIIEIQRAVLQYRRSVHDVSPDLDRAGHELLLAVDRRGLAGLPTSASTAHISAVDSDGVACALTVSTGYGAGVVVPGTGILLNNALGEIELNRLGLHALAPGTRLASNMAPLTGRTADGRVLAAGSPGADRITTALMQVLGQGCLHGRGLQEAIDAPRVHVAFDGEVPVVHHESDPGITAALHALGLRGIDHGERAMFFGGVGAALRHPDGTLEAAGDPRREAAVALS